jgi:hypothetical protein
VLPSREQASPHRGEAESLNGGAGDLEPLHTGGQADEITENEQQAHPDSGRILLPRVKHAGEVGIGPPAPPSWGW